MPVVKKEALDLAISNVATHGDTDVFPFPLENCWFHEQPSVIREILEAIDRDFDGSLQKYPVLFEKSLTGVGYTGFRAATQIDPLWNAYFLALVLEIAPDIEKARLARDRRLVFSYRLEVDQQNSTLFAPDLGWRAFQETALERARNAEYVLSTDISDFYSRIYHHRLENALQQVTTNQEAVKRIRVLLLRFASEASYGLPVGGNASRLLAEILLNRSDLFLLLRKVNFLRFVDDYYVFAKSREEAQAALVTMSEALLLEGLSLSRSKTRLMTRAEFERSSPLADENVADSETESEARRFLKVRLAYDPYSPTANDDYAHLSAELDKFDIVGMLAREFKKSRIDETLVRQLVKSIRFLNPNARRGAVNSLLSNLATLYPIFPTVAILLRMLLPELDDEVRTRVFAKLRELLSSGSHITMVPTNLAYALRLLAHDRHEESDSLLVQVYDTGGMLLKRDILLAMARRRSSYWLSFIVRRFGVVTPWERRALLVASYTLGDEGRHWRDSVRPLLDFVEQRFLTWVGAKNDGRAWDIPL
jgi:hypothetical protein